MDRNDLLYTINNIKKTTPVLIVGEATTLFRKSWSYRINTIESKQDVRDLIEYYSQVTPRIPLVIDDLSYLKDDTLNLLLKLIEDAKFPIILLASYDNVNPILFSRVKTFIKFKQDINSKFMDEAKAMLLLEEANLENKLDIIKFMRDNCPNLISLPKGKFASILYGGERLDR